MPCALNALFVRPLYDNKGEKNMRKRDWLGAAVSGALVLVLLLFTLGGVWGSAAMAEAEEAPFYGVAQALGEDGYLRVAVWQPGFARFVQTIDATLEIDGIRITIHEAMYDGDGALIMTWTAENLAPERPAMVTVSSITANDEPRGQQADYEAGCMNGSWPRWVPDTFFSQIPRVPITRPTAHLQPPRGAAYLRGVEPSAEGTFRLELAFAVSRVKKEFALVENLDAVTAKGWAEDGYTPVASNGALQYRISLLPDATPLPVPEGAEEGIAYTVWAMETVLNHNNMEPIQRASVAFELQARMGQETYYDFTPEGEYEVGPYTVRFDRVFISPLTQACYVTVEENDPVAAADYFLIGIAVDAWGEWMTGILPGMRPYCAPDLDVREIPAAFVFGCIPWREGQDVPDELWSLDDMLAMPMHVVIPVD